MKNLEIRLAQELIRFPSITPIDAKAGDIIFFTSGMEHRVAPVTKGVRYSLVNWFVGPPVV